MSDYIFYFAYGSNMSLKRIKARIDSAEFLYKAKLFHHTLKFHKISKKDGSGKCDAAFTGNRKDFVFGAVFSINTTQLKDLDTFEGCGSGYCRKTVCVITDSNEILKVETYIATSINNLLYPFDWYKEHVIRGAESIGLPSEYISKIEVVHAQIDPNLERKTKELSIYQTN
jgi:gamma-glutamylcyclotransferase